jgi:phage shock protein C
MTNYCSHCGQQVSAGASYCPGCGQALGGARAGVTAAVPAQRRLVRPRLGRMIAGVCQGVAVTYGWDPTLVRVVFVLLACFSGVGLILYVVMWIAAPEEPLLLQPDATYPPPQPGA